MSLGGARNDGGGAFLLDNVVDNLDQANMVVAIAAGNEGPGYFTVHYPGAAPRALTAGASTVGHGIVNSSRSTASITRPSPATSQTSSATSPLRSGWCRIRRAGSPRPEPRLRRQPAAAYLTGKIALLGRGTCDFTVKMRNAQNAGAVGVIMVDRVQEPPFVMSHNDLEPRPTIPGVMVSLSDGASIDDHDGDAATLKALGVYGRTPATPT